MDISHSTEPLSRRHLNCNMYISQTFKELSFELVHYYFLSDVGYRYKSKTKHILLWYTIWDVGIREKEDDKSPFLFQKQIRYKWLNINWPHFLTTDFFCSFLKSTIFCQINIGRKKDNKNTCGPNKIKIRSNGEPFIFLLRIFLLHKL